MSTENETETENGPIATHPHSALGRGEAHAPLSVKPANLPVGAARPTGGDKRSLIKKMADRYSVDPDKMLSTLKATAFKLKDGEVTNEQMLMMLVICDQYNLNPFTREIYPFPDKGGIVAVVGVDGWARIMNEHPMFNGIEFEQDEEKCTAIIYRKDRDHPIKVTEYLRECKRNTSPWSTHPMRLMRHKSMIQCGRIAFGFGGIYDPDEAMSIREGNVIDLTPEPDVAATLNAQLELEPDAR